MSGQLCVACGEPTLSAFHRWCSDACFYAEDGPPDDDPSDDIDDEDESDDEGDA